MNRIRRSALPFLLACGCVAVAAGSPRFTQRYLPYEVLNDKSEKVTMQAAAPAKQAGARASSGAEIVDDGGYPELRVDGKPFFIHSAAFFYYRIPADQWERLLRMYRSYGINTIDLYIPWNWHEPKEGEIDFDGHTNPRRNLRALLSIIARENLKLIARPGPEILNEWRHGGYPGWLLERPEYKMDAVDWLEGRYPPLDEVNPTDAEAAAEGWLANATHMQKSRAWLTAVSKELAPYSARRIVHVDASDAAPATHDVSGPLLFVQLGDDFAVGRANRAGPDFWRYVEALRTAVVAGGVTVPVFVNPIDMRVSAAGSAQERPIGVMGQWYLPRRPVEEGGVRRLTAEDVGDVEFYTEELKTQPAFPPVMIEYQAGWYTAGDDDRPIESPPESTLLSSRLLIANGIHGINYFPLQDTYSPAGYSVPWVNRSYGWDAALAPDGEVRPRMHAVVRNTDVLQRWGPLLAASHKRADFGIVYPLGSYPQERLERADIALVSATVMRIERLGALATLSSEVLDPQYQPVEQLLRNAVLLLPVFDPEKAQYQMSEKAQRAIVEYVRRGGTLVVFPERPRGSAIDALWKDAPAGGARGSGAANSGVRARWKCGAGEVVFSTKDFYSWIRPARELPELRGEREAEWARGVLHEFLYAAGVRPSVRNSATQLPGSSVPSNFLISEIVSNEGTEELGVRKGGRGFVSVTNLSAEETVDRTFEILPAGAPARGADSDYLPIHVIVPPRESLLLPLEQPICFADPANAPCGDSVTAAGAELLDAQRDGKTLELLWYAPTRAEIRLQLAQKPRHLSLDDSKIDGVWTEADHSFEVTILRGAAPRFARVLSLDMPTRPHVDEAAKPAKPTLDDIDYFVSNAVRLPTGGDGALRTYPPLIAPPSGRGIAVVVQGENQTGVANLALDISVSGALHGSGGLLLLARGISIEKVALKPSLGELMAQPPAADGLLRGTMEVKMGRDRRTIPVAFVQPRESGVYLYRYDFDRDGADEWVLENASLRLIVSPESGGRALALMDKTLGANLSTSVGLFRDDFAFTENPPGADELRARGRYGLFNRTYAAEWEESEKKEPILKLRYDAPDIYPSGASIEKTIRFEGVGGLRAEYRVALKAASAASGTSEGRPQAFVAVNSLPAFARPGRVTRFCWTSRGDAKADGRTDAGAEAKGADASKGRGEPCADFQAGGKPIVLPAGTRRVEVYTAGRPTTALEWDCAAECARMTIEPKNFSALFRLEFPRLTPGGDAGRYTIRVRTIRGE